MFDETERSRSSTNSVNVRPWRTYLPLQKNSRNLKKLILISCFLPVFPTRNGRIESDLLKSDLLKDRAFVWDPNNTSTVKIDYDEHYHHILFSPVLSQILLLLEKSFVANGDQLFYRATNLFVCDAAKEWKQNQEINQQCTFILWVVDRDTHHLIQWVITILIRSMKQTFNR